MEEEPVERDGLSESAPARVASKENLTAVVVEFDAIDIDPTSPDPPHKENECQRKEDTAQKQRQRMCLHRKNTCERDDDQGEANDAHRPPTFATRGAEAVAACLSITWRFFQHFLFSEYKKNYFSSSSANAAKSMPSKLPLLIISRFVCRHCIFFSSATI